MTSIRLTAKDILSPERAVRLTRARLTSRRPVALHDHDFHELLWVQNGRVRHHLPDEVEDLAEGDLIFVNPGHQHALQGRGDEALVVSLTIRAEAVALIGQGHDRLTDVLFWSRGPRPTRLTRDSRQMAALNQAAIVLERSGGDQLALQAFLSPLLDSLSSRQAMAAEAPDWLVRVANAAREPEVFRDGAAGLARVAGRAHPHVSRTVRRFFGLSPTDLVNRERMAFAAIRLAGSTDSLAEIAADCGIPNLSHFHKLFRAHHGKTPAAWRKSHQDDVVQPG
jgi:AraC family transcriptional regulator, dual regulator of chb operon